MPAAAWGWHSEDSRRRHSPEGRRGRKARSRRLEASGWHRGLWGLDPLYTDHRRRDPPGLAELRLDRIKSVLQAGREGGAATQRGHHHPRGRGRGAGAWTMPAATAPAIRAAFLGTCTNPYDSRPSVTLVAGGPGAGQRPVFRRHAVRRQVRHDRAQICLAPGQQRHGGQGAVRSAPTPSTATPAPAAWPNMPLRPARWRSCWATTR